MTSHKKVRVGALVITTAALAVAGCGSSSSSSVSHPATTASAQSAPSAQFVSQAHALVVDFQAASQQFQQAAQAAGTDLGAIDPAAKALQASATKFADGLEALTPPSAKAAVTADYIAVTRDFAVNMGKLGTAAAASDQAGLHTADVAIKADGARIKALNAQFGY